MTRWLLAMAVAAVPCTWPAVARAQMPDLHMMAGMSMPTADLPDGSVSVRVVRDQIMNTLPGVTVKLVGAGADRTAKTGADGRATFEGVPAGATVHAVADVDGQHLESREFEMPASGGVRTVLAVFTEGGAASGAAPGPSAGAASPAPGPAATTRVDQLSLSGNSRVATEFADDVLQVFYLLEIVNRGKEAVAPSSPLVIELPKEAEGATVLDGSAPSATASGRTVRIAGPFAPGPTQVQVAYRVDTTGSDLELTQSFPLPIDMLAVAVQKVGDMRVASPQITRTQDAPIQGSTYIMGSGPRVPAGTPVAIRLSGLPHHPRTGVYIALGLAALIVCAGIWLASSPGPAGASEARRRALEARQQQGLASLARLERDRQAGRVEDADYAAARQRIVEQLERVYGELDREGGPGGQGVAA